MTVEFNRRASDQAKRLDRLEDRTIPEMMSEIKKLTILVESLTTDLKKLIWLLAGLGITQVAVGQGVLIHPRNPSIPPAQPAIVLHYKNSLGGNLCG